MLLTIFVLLDNIVADLLLQVFQFINQNPRQLGLVRLIINPLQQNQDIRVNGTGVVCLKYYPGSGVQAHRLARTITQLLAL